MIITITNNTIISCILGGTTLVLITFANFKCFNRWIAYISLTANFLAIHIGNYTFGGDVVDMLYNMQSNDFNFGAATVCLLLSVLSLMIIPLSLGFLVNNIYRALQNIDLSIMPAILILLAHRPFTTALYQYPLLLSLICAYLSFSIAVLYKTRRGDKQFTFPHLILLFMRFMLISLLILAIRSMTTDFVSDVFTLLVIAQEVFRPTLLILGDADMINLKATWGEQKNKFGETKDSILNTNSIGVDPALWSSFLAKFKTGATDLMNRTLEQSYYKHQIRIDATNIFKEIGAEPSEKEAMKNYLIKKEGIKPESKN